MNNNQKEYIVTKIKKYNKEIDKKKLDIVVNTICIGILGSGIFTAAMMNCDYMSLYVLPVMAMAYNIRKLIKAICKKTRLEINKEQLDNLLGFDNLIDETNIDQEENIEGRHR